MDTHTHTHTRTRTRAYCLLCTEVCCHVVDVEGGFQLRWVMYALIGSASQYVSASIQDAQLQWTVGRKRSTILLSIYQICRMMDSGGLQVEVTVVYLSHPSRCGHAAVNDLTIASHLSSSEKFTSLERTALVIKNGEQHPLNSSVLNSYQHLLSNYLQPVACQSIPMCWLLN